MNRTPFAVLLALIAFPLVVLSKGDGRSFVIEGRVRTASAAAGGLELSINGDLLVRLPWGQRL